MHLKHPCPNLLNEARPFGLVMAQTDSDSMYSTPACATKKYIKLYVSIFMTPNDFLKESKLNEFLTLANTLPISENQAKNCIS